MDAQNRIDPTGLPDDGNAAALAGISFLRKEPPLSAGLRLAALGAFALYAGFNLYIAISNRRPTPELAGIFIGSLIGPLVVVWIAGFWEKANTRRGKYKVFTIAALVMLAVNIAGVVALRGYIRHVPGMESAPMAARDYQQQAIKCAGARDLPCAEENWARYLQERPADGRAIANLGMIKNRRDDHAGAIAQFEKAIALGNGTYDLFSYYADSLAKVGRTADAIDWSYRALAANPNLVDVTGSLATLLVSQQKRYEALSLLQAFDAKAEASGSRPFFTAQRIAIENALGEQGNTQGAERGKLRLSAYAGHFFAPVTLGTARPVAFLVDTGATRTTISQAMLDASKVRYRVMDPDATLITADGRKVAAHGLIIESLRVGPYMLRDVKAVSCKDCTALLGQSTLSAFDMQSSLKQGVEFLTLAPRAGALAPSAGGR